MTLFLSDSELIELTGFCRKEKQKEFLRKNKIEFVEKRGGYPVVSRAIFLNVDNLPKSRVEPNFGAL